MGAGLAGLVATAELADAGKRVILVDQEPEASLGGQAFWSFGGLFLVDSRSSAGCGCTTRWSSPGRTGWARPASTATEDHWPRQWAEAYVEFAAGEKRAWLKEQGIGFFPVVGWAERGGYGATGPGNSVPRFHITWGTGPGVVEPFDGRVRAGVDAGLVELGFRHRVDELVVNDGVVDGVPARSSSPAARRGEAGSRTRSATSTLSAQAVVVTSGGIGGNHELVRAQLAGLARHRPPADADRRAGTRRRAHARDHQAAGA